MKKLFLFVPLILLCATAYAKITLNWDVKWTTSNTCPGNIETDPYTGLQTEGKPYDCATERHTAERQMIFDTQSQVDKFKKGCAECGATGYSFGSIGSILYSVDQSTGTCCSNWKQSGTPEPELTCFTLPLSTSSFSTTIIAPSISTPTKKKKKWFKK